MEKAYFVGFAPKHAIERGLRPGDTEAGKHDSVPHLTVYKVSNGTHIVLKDYRNVFGVGNDVVPFLVKDSAKHKLVPVKTCTPNVDFAYKVGFLAPSDVIVIDDRSIEELGDYTY